MKAHDGQITEQADGHHAACVCGWSHPRGWSTRERAVKQFVTHMTAVWNAEDHSDTRVVLPISPNHF